jgi:hypothetical protein
MDKVRKPFQGTWNIIRFNWHFYALAIVLAVLVPLITDNLNATIRLASLFLVVLIYLATLVSLGISCYIYDFSDLYKLTWLDKLRFNDGDKMININAGFDETSELLRKKFPDSSLSVFDFYNPEKHTEVSIKRARKAYPPFPGTQRTSTNHLLSASDSADKIFIIFSAHEIRERKERILFFQELKRVMAYHGQIILTEHLRDTANFLAYNVGFMHFHSKKEWLKTFQNTGLHVVDKIKITQLVTTFILEKNGFKS